MKNSAGTWLAGCGVGCAALVAGTVFLGIGGYFSVKRTFDEFKDMGETVARVEREYGSPEDFLPWADGRIPAERLEAFLLVRQEFVPTREAVRVQVADLDRRIMRLETEGGSFWGVIGVIRQSLSSIPGLAEFQKGRAEALLEGGMGLGEYRFLYTLAFYSYLGKSPSDGPRFNIQDQGSGQSPEAEESGDTWEKRRRHLGSSVNRFYRSAFKQLIEQCEGGRMECDPDWLSQVKAELVELALDPERLPWQDGLPPGLSTSIDPYRDRLETSYDPLLNPLEMMPFQR